MLYFITLSLFALVCLYLRGAGKEATSASRHFEPYLEEESDFLVMLKLMGRFAALVLIAGVLASL